MKKILALLLVLGMASMANATIIDVVPTKLNGVAVSENYDLTGVVANDEIQIALRLRDNDSMSPAYPSYDGYWLLNMDMMITVTGEGVIDHLGASPPPLKMQHNQLFSAWADPYVLGNPLVVNNKITPLVGVSIANSNSGIGPEKDLGEDIVWNLKITLDSTFAAGDIVLVDLALNDDPLAGLSKYTNQPTSWGDTYDITERIMTNSDLGDLTIGIPEPMTIALLGLGGLGLIRRRRRA